MSDERPIFAVYPLCLPYLRKQVEEVAEDFNPSWLLLPKEGELFQSATEYFQYL